MSRKPYRLLSLDLPELQPYRTLRMPLEHKARGIFVAEGEKVVRRLLASSLTIDSILLTPEWLRQLETELARRFPQTGPAIYLAERNIMESIVGYNLHQGLMAVARIPTARSLTETIADIPFPRLLLALDGLMNSENVGVVVRNAAAFGVDALIVGETSGSPYLRRAVRNSMGAVFCLPIVHVDNLASSLQFLADQHDTGVIGAEPQGEGTIHNADFRGNLCIVIGSEGSGLSQNVRSVCTQRIGIPMYNETDSLNVSCASAVFLYEARKQRSPRPG